MRRKTDKQKEADKKGKERIKQYEGRKENKENKEEKQDEDDGMRTITCYQKIGDDDWEPIEYTYKVDTSKRPRKTKRSEPESPDPDDSESNN